MVEDIFWTLSIAAEHRYEHGTGENCHIFPNIMHTFSPPNTFKQVCIKFIHIQAVLNILWEATAGNIIIYWNVVCMKFKSMYRWMISLVYSHK